MKILPEMIFTLVAMFGGIAKHLSAYLKEGVPVSIATLGANAIVSGFSGYIFAQVVIQLYPTWALVAAGIGGYLGTEALDYLVKLGRKKFHV